MEGSQRCAHCQVRPALRKYCRDCSPRASAICNRLARQEAKAAGEKYWLAWWEKAYGEKALAERRTYNREYMRKYRRRGGPRAA